MKRVLLLAIPFLIAGCATKQYPQSPELSADEKNILSCEDVRKEIVKQESVISEINRTGNFDGRTVLGFMGDFGKGMGLTKDWAYRIVKHVGNYGESFERTVGENSKLKIKRGLNNLWSKGGLQYAPPVR